MKRLIEKLKLMFAHQARLQQMAVRGSCFVEFEEHYKNSYTDGISFLSKLQHKDLYEVLDLISGQWIKQNYTYLVDNNEQETTQKMIHGYCMGWLRPYNHHFLKLEQYVKRRTKRQFYQTRVISS